MTICCSSIKRFISTVAIFQILWGFLAMILLVTFVGQTKGAWANTFIAASCSAKDIETAISKASTGDIVEVPSGSCTWGETIKIDKEIMLRGAGIDSTNININVRPGILISARANISGFTFRTSGKYVISVQSTASNFRIYDNKFYLTGSGTAIYVGGAYGLIDSNIFELEPSALGSEVIFVRGPENSWLTPNSIGGKDNLFVEDNTFTLSGVGDTGSTQAIDCNANSRVVFRYNNVTNMKFDAHGLWSNTPAHSARHYEVYNNHFYVSPGDGTVVMWRMMEIRGGTGRIFNNICTGMVKWGPDKYPDIRLIEYCDAVTSMPNGNCTNFVCPSDYPMMEQVGRGLNNSLKPLYLWNNTRNGVQIGAHLVDWPSRAAIDYCGFFEASDIIKENRDFYVSDTKPEAIADYTPYPYPHPLRSAGEVPPHPSNLRIR